MIEISAWLYSRANLPIEKGKLEMFPVRLRSTSSRAAFAFQLSPFFDYGLRRLSSQAREDIKSLEDLSRLKSLEGVSPELIRRLINERTIELNVRNELDMLKELNKQEKMSREVSLKRFIRPLWVFFLMSSTVYLAFHYVWWRLEVVEKEKEWKSHVENLELELDQILKSQKETSLSSLQNNDNSKTNDKPWYKKWLPF